MKNKRFYSKILPVFSIILLFFLLLNSTVKASFTDDFPDMVYPDGVSASTNNADYQGGSNKYVCNKIVVKYKGNNTYYVINFLSSDYDKTRRLYLNSNNVVCMESSLYMQYLKWTGSTWSYAGWSGYSGGNASNVSGEPSYSTLVSNYELVGSSKDVYKDNTFNDVFFQSPPKPTSLMEVMSVEMEEKRTVQEILGILPLIIVVVVSFLGLRKALRILVTFLRRS